MNTESIIQPDPQVKGERGPAMKGADVLVAALERENVDTIFAYPGGASMSFIRHLPDLKKFALFCPVRNRAVDSWRTVMHGQPAGLVFAWPHPVLELLIW